MAGFARRRPLLAYYLLALAIASAVMVYSIAMFIVRPETAGALGTLGANIIAGPWYVNIPTIAVEVWKQPVLTGIFVFAAAPTIAALVVARAGGGGGWARLIGRLKPFGPERPRAQALWLYAALLGIYGYGIQRQSLAGEPILGHAGNIDGWSGEWLHAPDRHTSVVILGNRADLNWYERSRELLSDALGLAPDPAMTPRRCGPRSAPLWSAVYVSADPAMSLTVEGGPGELTMDGRRLPQGADGRFARNLGVEPIALEPEGPLDTPPPRIVRCEGNQHVVLHRVDPAPPPPVTDADYAHPDLPYAQSHPDRVAGLLVSGVFLADAADRAWWWEGARTVFPEVFAARDSLLDPVERRDPRAAFLRRILDPDPAVHGPAATVLGNAEAQTLDLYAAPPPDDVEAIDPVDVAGTRIFAHYDRAEYFLTPGQLIAGAARLDGVPGEIVAGRSDMCTPPRAAWELARAWVGSRLTIVPAAGHRWNDEALGRAVIAGIDRLAARF